MMKISTKNDESIETESFESIRFKKKVEIIVENITKSPSLKTIENILNYSRTLNKN